MKGVLVVLLAALLLGAVGVLPVFAQTVNDTETSETPVEKTEESEVRSDLTIIQLQPPGFEFGEEKLQKYFDLNISRSFDEDETHVYTLVGLRKDWFDFAIGWSQQVEPENPGEVTLSFHFWW